MMTKLLLMAVVTQAPVTQAPADSAADRAAAAAEKAAAAAERSSEAIARIADKLAPAPPPAPVSAAEKGWTGTAGFGLSLLGGNTQSITLTASVGLDKKWEVWSLGVRATGAYGLTNPDTSAGSSSVAQTVARRASATVRGDRSFGGFVAIFALGGGEFDHVKNIESRGFGEAGTSFTLFDEKQGDLPKLFLRLDLAIRGGGETRFTYFPTPAPVSPYFIPILAPRIAGTFRWALNENFKFSEDLEVVPYLLPPTTGRFLINSSTKINAKITERVALTLGFQLNVDTDPPNPALRVLDYALTAGTELAL